MATTADWTIEEVVALLDEWTLEPGLRVEELWEEVHDGNRYILGRYADERAEPVEVQGFFWNVTEELGLGTDELSLSVADLLGIYLEEAFHTAPPWSCHRDADGLAWANPWYETLPPGRDGAPLVERARRSIRVNSSRWRNRWGWRLRQGLGRLVGIRYEVVLTPVDERDLDEFEDGPVDER